MTADAPAVAHETLWKCIAGYPGFRTDGTTGESGGHPGLTSPNGLYHNILQMTWGWLDILRGDPNDYTPDQIMAYAEQGYKSSGYSQSWLTGQWPHTAWNCLSHA